MRFRHFLSATILILIISVPGFAQGAGNSCDLSGTWYGGSDPHFQYLSTLSSMGAGRYSSTYQLAADVHPFGYVARTTWTGEAFKTGPRTYEQYAMSYWIWDPAAAAEFGQLMGITIDPTLPEVDIVRGRLELVDCNTLTNTIDVYAAYFNFTPDKAPFVTTPDIDFLVGGSIVETYHRMPLACPECPFASTMSSATAAPAWKLGKGPHQKK